jgi:hypothetical protein
MPSVLKLIYQIPKSFKGTRKVHNANTLTPPKSTNTPTPPKRTLRNIQKLRKDVKDAERQAKLLAEYRELFGSRTYDPNINHSFYGELQPHNRINLNNRENLRDIPPEQIMELNITQLRDLFKSLKYNNEPTKEDINAELHRQEKIKDSVPGFVERQKQLKKERDEREMMAREESRTKTVSRRGGRRRHTKKRHSPRR